MGKKNKPVYISQVFPTFNMTYNLYISHSAWVVVLKGKIALPRQIFSKRQMIRDMNKT